MEDSSEPVINLPIGFMETKRLEFEETTSKDFHMARWREEVTRETRESCRYLKVSQTVFDDFIRHGDYRQFETLVCWKADVQELFEGESWSWPNSAPSKN
jgi:hypothetical protein